MGGQEDWEALARPTHLEGRMACGGLGASSPGGSGRGPLPVRASKTHPSPLPLPGSLEAASVGERMGNLAPKSVCREHQAGRCPHHETSKVD